MLNLTTIPWNRRHIALLVMLAAVAAAIFTTVELFSH